MSVFRLDGKAAVITGAAGGFGSAIAHLFASQGALVFLADLNQSAVEALAKDIGPSAIPHRADLSKVEECRGTMEKAVSSFGHLDILVNNAGICPRVSFLGATEQEWDRIVAVNQKSMFFCSQAAAPHLKKTHGAIVSVASVAGRAGAVANASIYSGTKGAILAITKAIARELAPEVRANAVAPGSFDTSMVRDLPPERVEALIQSVPLKRLGTSEEVAAAILYLAADESGYMTGATIDLNGGIMML